MTSDIISSTSHKRIGWFYLIVGLSSVMSGYELSHFIRDSLKHVGHFYMSSYVIYQSCITLHAFVMIFFAVMPTLIGGAGNYFIPIYSYKNEMDMPRFNAFSVWLMIPAWVFLWSSLIVGHGPATSWTIYPPLSSKIYHSSYAVDLVIFSLHLAGGASVIASINFIITAVNFNSATIGYTTMSILVWCMVVTSFLLILAVPVLAAAITMLLTERNFNSLYFNVHGGGDPNLFSHMFWFFGHPEVYIIVAPGFGVVSTASMWMVGKDQMVNQSAMFAALGALGLLGFVVWAHHMFTAMLDIDTKMYFMGATMVISVPTGVKIFSWVTTFASGEFIQWNSISQWMIGFMLTFTAGGASGVVLSNCFLDKLLHDGYYVLAHFHLVLSMGAIFSAGLAIVLWGPVITGLCWNDTLAQTHMNVFSIAVMIIFMPMHQTGLMGLPRKVVLCPYETQSMMTLSVWGQGMSEMSMLIMMMMFGELYLNSKFIIDAAGNTLEFFITPLKEVTLSSSPIVFSMYTQ